MRRIVTDATVSQKQMDTRKLQIVKVTSKWYIIPHGLKS